MYCSCGTDVPIVDDECESVVCGRCALYRCLIYEDELRTQYPPERLTLLRKARSISQGTLAYSLVISQSQVAQFERGKINCPKEIMGWISRESEKENK